MDEHESGIDMMLSAMVSPSLDDDLPWNFDDQLLKTDDSLDSAAQSPSSSLFDDFDDSSSSSLASPSFTTTTTSSDSGTSSLSSFDMMMNMFPDPTNPTVSEAAIAPVPIRKNVVVKRRPRECSMVCWLFRTMLTSEYRALPINAIFEIFEETMQQTTAGSGRHYRQSIRHCLMTSAVFVRVLTPNPRKDFLVMNEQGSWWTVHPDCESACAEHVFRSGAAHRCPPLASIPAYYSRIRMEDAAKQTAPGPIRTSYGYASTTSSECSSTSSSSASSPAPSTVSVRRFDPIRKVTYGTIGGPPRVTYKKFATNGYPQKVTTVRSTGPMSTQSTLLNPRSILLNDIAIDHEEVI